MRGETSAAAAAQTRQFPLIQGRRFFALLTFAALLWHVPLEAQTLLVFDDKAAFLAATGAASATGPLPTSALSPTAVIRAALPMWDR